jgi:aminoglycoside phosphotransferase (APT) family kinase protein
MGEPGRATADVPGVSTDALRTWMSGHGLGNTGALALERVGLGQSNLTYRVTDEAGQRWVLRRPPLGELLQSAHDVVREARILCALGPTPVPVPHVYGTLQPGVVDDDAPAVVMAWVDGIVIDRPEVVESMSPTRREAAARSLARALAGIHAVDVRQAGLDDLASQEPYAPRQLRRWSTQWRRSQTRDLPLLDELTERLWQHVPAQSETTLVHGDLHLRNVITSPQSGEVAAVLDWELSTLGDPLADVGTLLAYWPAADEVGIDPFAPSALPGFPAREELVTTYAEASGRDTTDVVFWHALGLWKLAVIGEGVLRRAQDQPLNRAASGTPTADRIEALVQRADAVAASAGI